jgi:hypothetical protein
VTFYILGALTALLAVGAPLYIFYPAPVEHAEVKTRLAYLRERKDVVYENLRDLNFEHKAGKLSEADYESLKSSMEEESAALLAEISRLENSSSPTGARG